MKIKNVAIKNFRGYSDEINSDFEDLTAFVGKNDIGKSTNDSKLWCRIHC